MAKINLNIQKKAVPLQGNLAAIDLGTNSCRLLIANSEGKILHRDSISTRLGENMHARMAFTPEAFSRGLEAFEKYAAAMKKFQVCQYRAIATASCRMASNGQDFVDTVAQKAGIKLDIIDEKEEAWLNLKGALLNVPKEAKFVVIYDLGGGSTEISLASTGEKPEMLATISIPWGARNASEAFDLKEYNRPNCLKLATEVGEYVDEFMAQCDLGQCRPDACLLSTSSTPLRLVSIVKQWGKYYRMRGDGVKITTAELEQALAWIYQMDLNQRKNSPYIGENRAPIFISACTIFKTIYDKLGFDHFTASLKSAQEGIIGEMIKINHKTIDK